MTGQRNEPLQSELWDREMNDQGIDHFGELMRSANRNRGQDRLSVCRHEPDNRESFMSRRSLFSLQRMKVDPK